MWLYNREIIDSLEKVPEDAIGFVYLITNISKTDENGNPMKYIGKKNIYSVRKVNLNKKEIAALESRRLKKWKTVVKESDWLKYTGSCHLLNEGIKEGDTITKEILCFAKSKRQLTYLEVKYQFVYEVLEKNDYYNSNIASSWFRNNIE